MKKILAILGAIGLIITTPTSVVACNYNTKNNNDNGGKVIDDGVQIFNTISNKITNFLKNSLFNKDIERNDEIAQKLYTKLETEKTYVLSEKDDSDFYNTFSFGIDTAIKNISQTIINEYSNYYQNSKPIEYNQSDIKITANYTDISSLAKMLGITVNDVAAININLSFSYNVKFKDYTKTAKFVKNFNMLDNLEILTTLKEGGTKYFSENLIDFLKAIKNVDLGNNSDFVGLYNSFAINYSDSSDFEQLDNSYKRTLRQYVKNNDNLKNADIVYNDNTNLLLPVSTPFVEEDLGSYYNNAEVGEKSKLSNWVKDDTDQITVNDFITYYKTAFPKLFITENNKIALGTFQLDLSYVIFYGLVLTNSIITDSNGSTFESLVSILPSMVDTKITNFGNIIVSFLKYFKVTNNKNDNNYFDFYVNEEQFNDLISDLERSQVQKKLYNFWKKDSATSSLSDLDLTSASLGNWRLTYANYNESEQKLTINYNTGAFSFGIAFGSLTYSPFDYWHGNFINIIKIS